MNFSPIAKLMIVLAASVYWFLKPNFIAVEVDDCLLMLREKFNHTMFNLMMEDNKSIGKIQEGYFLLNISIIDEFVQFSHEHIGVGKVTNEEIHKFTQYYYPYIKKASTELEELYGVMQLVDLRTKEFHQLYDSINSELQIELGKIREAVNKKPKSKSCWTRNKNIICSHFESIAQNIDDIIRIEARYMERNMTKLSGRLKDTISIPMNCFERCIAEYISQIKQCLPNSIKDDIEIFDHQVKFINDEVTKIYKQRLQTATTKIEEYFNKNKSEWKSFLDKRVYKCIENTKAK